MKILVLAIGVFLLIPAYNAEAREVVPTRSAEVQTERRGVHITGRLQQGHLTGEANEYVYWPDIGGHTASQLTWEIDHIAMIGAGISVQPLRWLAVNTDTWFNISDGSGTMDDYDWLEPGKDWTHWSHHEDTAVTKGIMLDISIEFSPPAAGPVTFSGFLGYKHENWEWEARGGSFIYSIDECRDTSGTFPKGELGITYEQTFHVPYIGFGINGDFRAFDIEARLIGSCLVSGEAVDHHHMQNLVTYDKFSGERMIAFDIAGVYSFTERLGIQMALTHTKYNTMKGDSDWHFNDESIVITRKDGAGADIETTMLSLSFLCTF